MLRVMKIEGQDRPVAICDLCHERIADAADARFYWATDEQGELVEKGRILFLHQRCSRSFENGNIHLQWCQLPLEYLPILLGDMLNLDWVAARKQTDDGVKA